MGFYKTKVAYLTVEGEAAGQRIDNFLLARLKGLPRSRLYRLMRTGEIRVNKGRIKPEYKIQPGDSVRVPPVTLPETDASNLPMVSESLSSVLSASILYEDSDWLVVDKPTGLAVHGGSGQSLGLIEAMRQLRTDCHYLELCHRIDRDTSGCIVLAKKRSALRRFHQGLRDKVLKKRYLALVVGHWPESLDTISVPLTKNVLKSGERMVIASADGKPSKTVFSVRERFDRHTLIEAQPVTGRTHQIRVHAKAAGHPIVGDDKYGIADQNKAFRRDGYGNLFLHAASISLPGEQSDQLIEAGLPERWQHCFRALRE